MPASAILFIYLFLDRECMCERLTEMESQPGEACEKKTAVKRAQRERHGAQISSRLIWKLCNEGSTVYI